MDLRTYYDTKALQFDELAATYESPIPYKRFFYGARFARVMALLAAAPGEEILDLGCGTGYYTRAALERGAVVTATEYAPAYLEQAQALVGEGFGARASFRIADAEQLPFDDESFDKVLITEVIEHVRDPERALAETRRVLRPGGQLVISTPSRRSPLNRAYGLKRRIKRYEFNEHLREFTIPEFRRFVSQQFRLERLEFANFVLPYPVDALAARAGRRVVPPLDFLERTLAELPVFRRLGWTMVARARRT